MKKLLALVLAAFICLCCAACGEDVRGTVSQGSGSGSNASGTQSASDEDAEFSIGSSSGGRYESKFLGIGCEFADDWKISSDDEIKAMNEQTLQLVGDDYAEAIKNADVIYDMMATGPDGVSNVSVLLENLGLANVQLISEEEYIDSQADDLKGALESMGFTSVEYKKDNIQFAGSEKLAFKISASSDVVSIYEVQVYIKKGRYIAVITATSTTEAGALDILSHFYAVG